MVLKRSFSQPFNNMEFKEEILLQDTDFGGGEDDGLDPDVVTPKKKDDGGVDTVDDDEVDDDLDIEV